MNRSLLILPVLLALAAGGWLLFGTETPGDSPAVAALPPGAHEEVLAPEPLPALGGLAKPVDVSPTPERGSLSRPRLSLLARRATDGRELESAHAVIEPVNAKTPVLTVQTRGVSSAPTELDPGSWRVTFEAKGYVSQTREVELALGDQEVLEVNLVRGALVTGKAQDRFGQHLGGSKLFFLAPGQVHPRFPREAEGILTTKIDKKGNIEPISVPPEMYTITYGNLGTPKLQTEGRLDAGETTELLIVLGGRNVVRFELDRLPQEERRMEVRLEEQDEKKLARDRQMLAENPARAAKLQQKGRKKERWRAQGQTRIENGVGEIHRAKPGVYRVTLLSRPGEYSSEPILKLKADESVVVRIQTPSFPARSGPKKADPKTPKDGPLKITVLRDPPNAANKPDGIYWR